MPHIVKLATTDGHIGTIIILEKMFVIHVEIAQEQQWENLSVTSVTLKIKFNYLLHDISVKHIIEGLLLKL
ncbi:hypothetical protein [Flavobacterium notoginsengisoli]|uniref:hypothetical protein n=1 Tax=Flavobacterium notoginsengisoli TaxID=1478199 RepID=UPI003644B87D